MGKDFQEKEETMEKTDRERWQSGVNLGMAFPRWRKLREEKGFKTDMELAIFLMDSLDRSEPSDSYQRSPSTPGPRKRRKMTASPPPALSISMDGSYAARDSGEDDESRSFEERTEDEDYWPPRHIQIGGAPHSPACRNDLESVDEMSTAGSGDTYEDPLQPSACKEEFSPSLGQEHLEPPLKKEEVEELLNSQVEGRLEEADTKDYIHPILMISIDKSQVASLHGPHQSQSLCVENGEGLPLPSTSIQAAPQEWQSPLRRRHGSQVPAQHSPLSPSTRARTPSRGQRKERFPLSEKRFQRKVIETLLEIMDEIRSIRRELQPDGRLDIKPSETEEEFDLLEEDLVRVDIRQQMMSTLTGIGGKSVRDCTNKMLDRLMTNAVMSNFNINGGGQRNKRAFKVTALYGVIFEAVMTLHKAKEVEVRSAIAEHLKQAPGRAGGTGYRTVHT